MLWVLLLIHEDLLSVYNMSDTTPPVTRDPCLQIADHLMVLTGEFTILANVGAMGERM